MSFARRQSSFLQRAGIELEPSLKQQWPGPLEKHDFFYDLDDLNVLKAGKLPKLAEMGGVEGLARALRTDLKDGFFEDEVSREGGFELRKQKYGINHNPRKPPPTFWELCVEVLEDQILRILIFSGCFSLGVGAWQDPAHGWLEGLAILIAVAIVTLVTAGNNYKKERQFRAIEEAEVVKSRVYRGGKLYELDSKEILVGDLMILDEGDKITADGILVPGSEVNEVRVNESQLTGEPVDIRKHFHEPFLYSGTEVKAGHCIMLVTAVGPHSEWGKIALALEQPRGETPLQKRLGRLADDIGKLGTIVAVILFTILACFWIYDLARNKISGGAALKAFINIIIVVITIIVVAVPEGLPLAVTISLSYSMEKMKNDNNKVRVLAACETMGNATMVCSDKTGTLTANQMTVVRVVLGGQFYEKIPTRAEINPSLLTVLLESECVNSGVQKTTAGVLAGGNQTAQALIRWVLSLGCDWTEIDNIRARFPLALPRPFNSLTKRSTMLVAYGDGSRLYVKGAFESVLARTRFILNSDGRPEPLDESHRTRLSKYVESMTKKGLRCIGIAYQDFGPIQYNAEGKPIDHDESQEAFTLIAIPGIQDPLREGVPEAVRRCQNAGIVVRMVTGDHPETARTIAREAGILSNPNQLVMIGPDFRALTDAERDELLPRMRVLARSSPQDKAVLVRWLRKKGEIVAVTGDGTNDAPALKAAHVGLAMGTAGTQVAIGAADIVLMDDNFSTIVKSVMWGRSVYDNIRKFLQFQVTVNIVALLITLIGAIREGFANAASSTGDTNLDPPLKAVQLLWVNLIMDTMGALALGTESPTLSLLDRKPYAKKAALVSKVMWRNIFGHAILQLAILLMILFGGDKIWDRCKDDLVRNTMVFNTFVFFQVFNEINSRKVNGEVNVFEQFFSNSTFVAIIVFTAALQAILVELCKSFVQTTNLTWSEWLACVGLGALALPWGFVVRLVPVDLTDGQIKVNPKDFEVAPFPDDHEHDFKNN